MSFSNLRSCREAGRVIVGAAIAAIAIAIFATTPHLFGAPRSDDPNSTSQHQAAQQNWQPHFSARKAYAQYQNTNCQSPTTAEEADLCQQWRMAEATEKAVALASEQYGWNVAQAIGTIIAAIATVLAAWAAVRAANAAQATVADTRRIGEAQVRAYVSWNGANLGVDWDEAGNAKGCSLMPLIKNTGQSPAHIVALYSHLELLPIGEIPEVTFEPTGIACNDTLGAGVPYNLKEQYLSMAEADAIFRSKFAGHLMGWAAFRDVFSVDGTPDRIVTFCFAVTFPQSLNLWTPQLIKEHGAKSVVDLNSVPSYRISPRGPYK